MLGRGNVSGADRNQEDRDQLLAWKASQKWVVRNVSWLKSFIRIFLGIVWLIDGYLKFSPGLVDSFPDLVRSAGDGQPTWLQPWSTFGPVSQQGMRLCSYTRPESWRSLLA